MIRRDPPAGAGHADGGHGLGAESFGSGLAWPIRRSFLQYVAGLPDGRAVLGRGATATERDGVLFPLAGLDAFLELGEEVTVKFAGEVAFTGHFGLLDVRLVDPVLLVRNGTGVLFNGGATGAGAVSEQSLVVSPIRHVGEATGMRRWVASAPLLTAYGSGLFGGAYPPGAPFDPFLASVPAPTPVPTPPTM